MVQVKAHLGNQWPQMNFSFLPIESDRADNDPSPPTAPFNMARGKEEHFHLWLNFDPPLTNRSLQFTGIKYLLTQKQGCLAS